MSCPFREQPHALQRQRVSYPVILAHGTNLRIGTYCPWSPNVSSYVLVRMRKAPRTILFSRAWKLWCTCGMHCCLP